MSLSILSPIEGTLYDATTKPGHIHIDASSIQQVIKSNLSAVVDPTTTDDTIAGYRIGSRWVNTVLDKVFECVDATMSAAVWKDLSSTGAPGGSNGQLQYNNSSSFGGMAGTSWNGSTLAITQQSGGTNAVTITGATSESAPVLKIVYGPAASSEVFLITASNGSSNLFSVSNSNISCTPALSSSSTITSTASGSASGPSLGFGSGNLHGLYRIDSGTIGLSNAARTIGQFSDVLSQHTYSNSSTTGHSLTLQKSRGSYTVPTAITSGDTLGSINGQGYSGAAGYVTGAQIRFDSEGTIATTRVPGKIVLATGTNAAPTVLTDRWTVDSNGHLLAATDNVYDIGALGATRPRSIYAVTINCASYKLDAGGSNGLFTDSGFPNIRDFNGLRRMSFGDSTSSTPIRAMTRMCVGASNYFTGGGVAELDVIPESAALQGLIIQGIASQTGVLAQLRGMSSTPTARERADWDTGIIDNTDATRKYRSVHRAWDTAAREYMRGWGDGSVGRVAVAAPASAPTDTHLAASQISFHIDEGANNLLIRAKYADGTTLKTATIALA